jgi:hypothetical protein
MASDDGGLRFKLTGSEAFDLLRAQAARWRERARGGARPRPAGASAEVDGITRVIDKINGPFDRAFAAAQADAIDWLANHVELRAEFRLSIEEMMLLRDGLVLPVAPSPADPDPACAGPLRCVDSTRGPAGR